LRAWQAELLVFRSRSWHLPGRGWWQACHSHSWQDQQPNGWKPRDGHAPKRAVRLRDVLRPGGQMRAEPKPNARMPDGPTKAELPMYGTTMYVPRMCGTRTSVTLPGEPSCGSRLNGGLDASPKLPACGRGCATPLDG
jgi:hypothetical protein